MRRRAVLGTTVALGLVLPLYSTTKSQLASFGQKLPNDSKINHALDRLTFGARPGDAAKVKHAGLKKWVEQQLYPERIPENPDLAAKLAPLASLTMSASQMWQAFPRPKGVKPQPKPLPEFLTAGEQTVLRKGTPLQKVQLLQALPGDKLHDLILALPPGIRQQMVAKAPPELRRQLIMAAAPQLVLQNDLFEAKLYRAIYSNRQLQEVLTDFWFNHFNVFLDKGMDRYLVTSYERDAIRPHVLGKFGDMLLATAKSPAMLYYLDNWQSAAPGSKRRRGLNENYGRELLELHTLGVNGGYTQKDVTEVARCFTGWTIKDAARGGEFTFNAAMHDKGEKTVLGVTIPAGGGMEDGLKVLDIVSHHPSTALFISRKLAERFVADDPPPALIERMAKSFRTTDGDIRAVMRTMLNSKEFWSRGAYQAKVKSPFEMVVSSVRALDGNVDYAFGLANIIAQMGQPLYRKVEPTGYSNRNDEWLNTAGVMGRMNFAVALDKNQVPGVAIAAKDLAVKIGSPEFQRR